MCILVSVTLAYYLKGLSGLSDTLLEIKICFKFISFCVMILQDLVLLYMEKIETSLSEPNSRQSKSQGRGLSLHPHASIQSLLDSPLGDFPDDLREGVTKSFIEIFSNLR